MTSRPHLSEEERHEFADGSLSPELRALAAAHIATCDVCSADVASLEQLVKRARAENPVIAGDGVLDDVWRGVRTDIERRKVLPLAAADARPSASKPGRNTRRWLIGAVAAVVLGAVGTELAHRAAIRSGDDTAPVSGAALSTVAESTQIYENEVETLLNGLELRRAMLRPETAASIDQSLRVIDQAVAELRDALVHDPNNPALRQLLASSYRQKVDLLKRVGNAS